MGHSTKEARAAYARLYRARHRERLNAKRQPLRHLEYLRHREQRAAYSKKRRLANRELLLTKEAAYRVAHREELNAKARQRYHSNNAQERAAKRAYYHRNREAMREYQKEYIRKHSEVFRKQASLRYRRYRKAHPETVVAHAALRRARKAHATTNRSADVFIKWVRSRRSIPCYYCGNPVRGRDAHVDHVVALSKSGNHSVENLCASCPDCNLSKHNRSLLEWRPNAQPLLNL